MRVFGRILYSILVVGFFLLAFTYSRDLMLTKYLDNVFGQSLIDQNSEYPKYYYFYTSIPDYHNNEPIININSNGYDIMGYEISTTSIDNNNQLIVEEYVYIIVYSDTEDLSLVDNLYLENTTSEEKQDINLQRFKTLNILNGINDQGYVYLNKNIFLDGNYNKINLLNKSGDILVSVDYNLNESDFTNAAFLYQYYNDNKKLPTIDDLSKITDNHIFPNKPHIADDYAYIFYIAMGIYFTLLIATTYLIYFKKKKHHY